MRAIQNEYFASRRQSKGCTTIVPANCAACASASRPSCFHRSIASRRNAACFRGSFIVPSGENLFSASVIWNKEYWMTIRQEEWRTGYVPQSMVSRLKGRPAARCEGCRETSRGERTIDRREPEWLRVLIRRGCSCGLLDRKADEECGPLTGFAFHANLAAVRIDDVFYDLGPQPRPSHFSAHSLIRKQAVADRRRYPRTGVTDGNANHPGIRHRF